MMNRRQTGLSLVELMVGLTLGLLLVGIAVSIYLSVVKHRAWLIRWGAWRKAPALRLRRSSRTSA